MREGDYIYFGSYPQSEVTDASLKTSLANAAEDTSGWTSYDYYFCGNVSDFMVYKDVSLDGEKYRGVYFTSYRSTWTTHENPYATPKQLDNGYQTNTVYWFKFEPIKWKILSEYDGDAFLCADMILDSQDFYFRKVSSFAYNLFGNNYGLSHIRAWLNDIFYSTAFNSVEKNAIKIIKVDNSASSTGISWNEYACSNTYDKIFLLSYSEVTNSTYGFDSNSSRMKYPTAYAKVQGVWWDEFFGTAEWLLRSPYQPLDDTGNGIGNTVRSVAFEGYVSAIEVIFIGTGVVPALHLTL